MIDKHRGFVMTIVVLVIIAFLGFSLSPLLGGLLEANQRNSQLTAPPIQTPAADQETDLLAQVRGYELILKREPDNQTALRGLLQVKLELAQSGLGNIEEVIPTLEKLSELNPDHTDYNVLLAQAKAYIGDRESAAQIYRSLLAEKPGDVKILQGLVSLLLQQERPEAAIGLLQDTLKAAPQVNQVEAGSIDVASVQLILGQVYAQQERYDEAIVVYDEAIKGNTKDFRPILAKAIILEGQGNIEAAQELFDQAIEVAPAAFKDQIRGEASANSVLDVQSSPEVDSSETKTDELENNNQ